MNRILLIFRVLLFASTASAQTQQGIVKTRGRVVNGKVVAGTRLSGVTITLNIGNPLVSGQNGAFSFNVPSGKNYSLVMAKKQGYTLADPEYIRRTFKYSACNPFYVVLEDEAQRQADIKEATDKVRKTLKRELRKREDELDELRESNSITQAKYDSLRMEFANYRQSSESLVNEMAERFTAIDYDQLDEFNRQVQQYIEEGELLRADSLINTRGSLDERYARVKGQEGVNAQREEEIRAEQESLAKSQELTRREKEDLMSDLYAKHTIYLQAYQQDSALYCLKIRANLDTTNLEAVWDYATLCYEQKKFEDSEKFSFSCLLAYLSQNNIPNIALSQNFLGNLYCRLHDYTTSEKYYKLALENYELLFQQNPDAYRAGLAMTQNNLGVRYNYFHNYAASEKFLKFSLVHRERLFRQNPESNRADLAGAQLNLGLLYSDLHDYATSEKYYKLALDNFEQLLRQNPDAHRAKLADAQNNFGNLYYDLNEYDISEKYYKLALENYDLLFNQNPDAHRVGLAMIQNNFGNLYYVLHDYTASEKYYKLALANYEHLFNQNPDAYRADLATTQNNLGTLYSKLHDYANSERYNMLALENYELLFNQYPDVYRADLAKMQYYLGNLYKNLHDYATSEKYYKLALTNEELLFQQNPDAYRADLAMTYWNVMLLYEDMGNIEEYDKCLGLALDSNSDLYQLQPALYVEYIIELQNRKVWRLLVKGDVDEAMKLAETTYSMDESNEDSKYYLAECCNNQSLKHANNSKFDNAYTWINKAIAMFPTNANFYDSKGEILLMQGRNEEALEMWKKVLELDPNFLDNYPDGTTLSNGLKKLGLIE